MPLESARSGARIRDAGAVAGVHEAFEMTLCLPASY